MTSRSLVLLALLGAGAFAAGCERKDGEPVAIGAEVSQADLNKALTDPLRDAEPSAMAVGAYAHWQDAQTLAGSITVVTGEAEQTIDARDDASDDEYILFTLIERKLAYLGTETREVITEREATARKPAAAAASVAGARGLLTAAARPAIPMTTLALERGMPGFLGQALGPAAGPLLGALAAAPIASAVTGGSFSALAAALPRVTRISFHDMKTSITRVAPPAAVAARPSCGGLPGCALNLHRIEFDQIAWLADGSNDKIHFRFDMSPDVPFLAGLLDRCLTALVPIGDTKTLLTQCSPMLDFRF